jgi:hypothetical protein
MRKATRSFPVTTDPTHNPRTGSGLTGWDIPVVETGAPLYTATQYLMGFNQAVGLLQNETIFEEYFQKVAHTLDPDEARTLPSFEAAQQLAAYLVACGPESYPQP